MPVRDDVEFDSGGTTCRAWLYRPDGAGTAPVIVMAHGLGGVRQMRLDAFAERFTAAGYACLVFDYRHFGASDGEPRQLLDITGQLEDWAAAIAYARSRGDAVDPARVIVWGTSFSGGHVGVVAGRDHGIAAAVAQCPFTDGWASARVTNPLSALRSGARGVADLVSSALGRGPVMVSTAGRPGAAALMTSPDSLPGERALRPAGEELPDEVCARFALQITLHRPGRSFGDVRCPILFCLCDHDTLAPAARADRDARRAAAAEVRHYPYGHFDIYVGEPFEHVVADQLEFLRRVVPVS